MTTVARDPRPGAAAPPAAAAALPVVRLLIERLGAAGVRFCHWKSNEHLGPALRGETDLDVLVDRAAAGPLAGVLAEIGFKRFAAPAEGSYVGVEDYLGFDPAAGRLVHLHLHYRLVLGEKFLKGHRLPWEEAVLTHCAPEPESGMPACDPGLELLILLVRAALKLRRRDRLSREAGARFVRGDLQREYAWLAARTSPARVAMFARQLLNPEAAELVGGTLGRPLSVEFLRELRRVISPSLGAYRTFGPREADRLRWSREWRVRWARARSRLLKRRVPIRFTVPRGGLVVAFLGMDGSGKSTVTRAIADWLAWRVEVLPLYLGFGDGPVSLLRRPLRAALKLRGGRRAGSGSAPKPGVPAGEPAAGEPAAGEPAAGEPAAGEPAAGGAGTGGAKTAWKVLWAWTIVREKQDRLRQAVRARNLGQVVICDRYPQAQVPGLGDGPLLSELGHHPIGPVRAAVRREEVAYRSLEALSPDLVIRLNVSPETSARRKSDVSLDSLRRRMDTMHRIRFPSTTRVVDVDAEQPLEEVLLQVKRAIWAAL